MTNAIGHFPRIKARIQILRSARSKPLMGLNSGQYMPHIVMGDANQRKALKEPGTNNLTEEYLGVRFVAGPDVCDFDVDFEAEMLLMYFPNVDYSEVLPGKTFTLREGGTIIGFGSVLSREDI